MSNHPGANEMLALLNELKASVHEFAAREERLAVEFRAGSAMATELGSMRITEQIDALTTFAVNPVHYLVTPRLVASILMLPSSAIPFLLN